jgi:hypothetical protein
MSSVSVSQRSWIAAVLIALASAVVCGVLGAFPGPGMARIAFDDGHAAQSLVLAASRAACPGDPRLRDQFTRRLTGGELPEALRNTPITAMPAQFGEGDLCALPAMNSTNNENTLMLLMQAALTVLPQATLPELATALLAMKLVALLFFAAVLARVGVPILAVFGALLLALEVLTLLNRAGEISVYPFLMPAVAAYAAAVVMACRQRKALVCVVAYAAVGAFAGLLINLRSSYAPVWIGLAVVAWAIQWGRVRVVFVSIAAFFGAALAAHQAIVASTASNPDYNYSHHPIGHPLVLSLALPPNPLTEREGIRWEDSSGLVLAQRMDPAATYLDQRYDRALVTYYFKLWREHPSEMAAIYAAKLHVGVMTFYPWFFDNPAGARGTVLARFYQPIRWLQSGAVVGAILVCLFGGVFLAARRLDDARLTLCAIVLAATIALFLEHVLIMSAFALTYHAPLVTFLGFVLIGLYWFTVEAVAGMRRLRPCPMKAIDSPLQVEGRGGTSVATSFVTTSS